MEPPSFAIAEDPGGAQDTRRGQGGAQDRARWEEEEEEKGGGRVVWCGVRRETRSGSSRRYMGPIFGLLHGLRPIKKKKSLSGFFLSERNTKFFGFTCEKENNNKIK